MEFIGKRRAFQLLILARRSGKPCPVQPYLVKNQKKGYEIGLTLHPLCDISRTSPQ
jgi:hypothetical protein